MTCALWFSFLLAVGADGYEVIKPSDYGVPRESYKDDIRSQIPAPEKGEEARWVYRVDVSVNVDKVSEENVRRSAGKSLFRLFWQGRDLVQIHRFDLWSIRDEIAKKNEFVKAELPEGDQKRFRRDLLWKCPVNWFGPGDEKIVPDDDPSYEVGARYWIGGSKIRCEVKVLGGNRKDYENEIWRMNLEGNYVPFEIAGNWIYRYEWKFDGISEKPGETDFFWKSGDRRYVEIYVSGDVPTDFLETFLKKHPSAHKKGETFDRLGWHRKEFERQMKRLEETLNAPVGKKMDEDPWCMQRWDLGCYFSDLNVPHRSHVRAIILPTLQQRRAEMERLRKWFDANVDRLEWSWQVDKVYAKVPGKAEPDKDSECWWQRPPPDFSFIYDPTPLLNPAESAMTGGATKKPGDGNDGAGGDKTEKK